MPFPQSDIAQRRFVEIELIGKGTFGNVYRATDQRLRRLIAVKEISAALPPEERSAAQQRFEREAQLVAQLSGQQVVSVYGYDEDPRQGEQYLYLEYVPFGTLAAALQTRGRLSQREAALVARDIARAIQTHWAHDIVH